VAIRYISTRGLAPTLNFEEVLLAGLASDGGLYVPDRLPRFTPEQIRGFRGMRYNELAFEILMPFVEGSIPSADLQTLIDAAYAEFRMTRSHHWCSSIITSG